MSNFAVSSVNVDDISQSGTNTSEHGGVIKWKYFPRYWVFVRELHRLILLTKASDAELWCFPWSTPEQNGWANNQDAGDLKRHRAHYDIIVMKQYDDAFRAPSLYIWDRHLKA